MLYGLGIKRTGYFLIEMVRRLTSMSPISLDWMVTVRNSSDSPAKISKSEAPFTTLGDSTCGDREDFAMNFIRPQN